MSDADAPAGSAGSESEDIEVETVSDSEAQEDAELAEAERALEDEHGIHPEMNGFIVPDGHGETDSDPDSAAVAPLAPEPTDAELAEARLAFEQRSAARFATATTYDVGPHPFSPASTPDMEGSEDPLEATTDDVHADAGNPAEPGGPVETDAPLRTGATRFAAVLSRWEDRLLARGQLPPPDSPPLS